jgi:hypothetical protein
VKLWPALWTFADVDDVEPTNNAAERGLRAAVIYRKLSLGSRSQGGERTIERLLSVDQTCRLQRRSLYAYLADVLTANSARRSGSVADGSVMPCQRPASRAAVGWLPLHDVDDWETRIGVEAGGGEEGGADVSVEERVAAAAVRGGDPLRLGEGVDGEAARPLEPALVAGARERLEEREAVTRGTVTEAVTLLVPVGTRTPDELGTGEQEVLVEILPGAGDDTWRAGAPLETDPTVSWPRELRTRRAGPVREAVLAERMSRENGRALASDGSVWLETEQSEGVSRDAV